MKRVSRDLLKGCSTRGYLDVDSDVVEDVFGEPQENKTWYVQFANGKLAKMVFHHENLHVGGFDDDILEEVQNAIVDECKVLSDSEAGEVGEPVGSSVIRTDPNIVFREDTFKYIMTLDKIRRNYDQRPSWIRITTITMMFKNGTSTRFDLDTIRSAFANGPIRVRRKGALFDGHEWVLRHSTFYNQVTVGYTDQYSTKSVKIFPNGTVHVTGCSDLYDCHRVSKQLAHLLSTIFELEQPLTADAFRVLMINTNFSMNKPVNQMDIIEHLSKDPRFEVSFKPERYSAVKIKFKPRPEMKKVTASVFSTGKVIVTGAQALQEIVFAYDTLNFELERFTYSPEAFMSMYLALKDECPPDKYEAMRELTIEAMSYYTPKAVEDIEALDDDNTEGYQLLEHAERLAAAIAKKQLDSFDTVFGSKFGEWVNMLAQRGVTAWV